MPGPAYGALGLTFQAVRLMEIICLITIIGLTANFVSEIISTNLTPAPELIGTLSVVCIGVIYCVVTMVLYIDNILPFLINTGAELLVLTAVVVVSVVIGRPLSYLNCQAIGDSSEASSASSAYDFTTAMGSQLNPGPGGVVEYGSWIGATKANCLEMKSIWGLSIALW
jgi:hypothetical protein